VEIKRKAKLKPFQFGKNWKEKGRVFPPNFGQSSPKEGKLGFFSLGPTTKVKFGPNSLKG